MNTKAKHVITNDIAKCNGCANARRYITEVEDISQCAGCPAAQRPYTGDFVDAIYDICIESANKLISALFWLLADDHKAGDFSHDEWTYRELNVIHAYIAYVKKCKGKGVIPMPLNDWLNKYDRGIAYKKPMDDEVEHTKRKFKGIREKLITQNELDTEYGDPVAYRKKSAHKQRLKKMQETQNSTSSNKNESSSDNSPVCM